ncbi:MAG: homocysteine S-methyltransferase family protein [Gammaproteobacteria bacterium]|jgi:homocysteine S-methyltransferase
MSGNWQADIAAGRTVIIDGGTGAELERRGVPVDPVCWHAMAALSHHAELVSAHVDFINAGADIITTNTFATHRFVMRAAGHEDDYARATEASVAAARRARTETGIPVEIAGSMSCMPPAFDTARYPDDKTARTSYVKHAHMLADLGVDLIALEMIQDLRHGGWALDAAIATGLPVWLGFACRAGATAREVVCFDFPDTKLETLLTGLLDREPQLVNIMHTPIKVVPAAFACLRAHWQGRVGVYTEVGSFDVVNRRRTERISPSEFAAAAKNWIELGAVAIGGCCGATPSHVAALTDETIADDPPRTEARADRFTN